MKRGCWCWAARCWSASSFAPFSETRFEELPSFSQHLKFASLLLMLLTLLMLIMPAAYHRIVEQGEATDDQHRITSTIMDFALLPFALGIGADVYIAVMDVNSRATAIACAIAAAMVTLFFWYGLEWIVRACQRNGGKTMERNENSGRTPLKDKIDHVLTECRVVLPGVQALLGFQLATTLMESFQKLPDSSKQLHLVSLALIALSMVLLMTPAAFHRIVEEGEETERLHRFASGMLLAALAPLALGIAGALFVVARKLLDSVPIAAAIASASALVFGIAWFGVTIYIRTTRHERVIKEASAAI